MNARGRRKLAYLGLALTIAGAVALGIGYWRTLPENFTAPATFAAAQGQGFGLQVPAHSTATATCTVAPAGGGSRQVSVPPGEDGGYHGDAWWSGTASITCDRKVSGGVLAPNIYVRMGVGFVVVMVLLFLGHASLAEIFGW
jgi:hypothetical protein